jgi:2-keto-4-pentenoate hydratase
MPAFDAAAAARFIADAHQNRQTYANLPDHLTPPTVADAYAAQEALRVLWTPLYGPVAGLKIATTTKVMQALMGIDHPCGGMIYRDRVHATGAVLKLADYMHLVLEAELAVRVSRTLDKGAVPYTADSVRGGAAAVMPAFELIEDRNAHYKSCKAYTLIADNAWNAGIVLGAPVPVPPGSDLNGLRGRLTINGAGSGAGAAPESKEGITDGPLAALAWVANLAADRGRPLEAGQVVITGSVIATFAVTSGDHIRFEIDGLGAVEATAA